MEVNLQYPLEKQNRYKGRISFQPLQVIPIEENAIRQLDKAINRKFGDRTSSESTGDIVNSSDFIESIDFRNAAITDIQNRDVEPNISAGLRITRLKEFCHLYIPTALAFNDNVSISGMALGAGGQAVSGALQSGGSVVGSIFESAKQAGSSFIDTFVSGFQSETAKVGASRLSRVLPGEGLQSGVNLSLQVVSNPNQRNIFSGVNLRTFTFAFKFVPLSPRESLEIENIIEWFRKELYPEQIVFGRTGVPYGYKFPNLFDVKIKYLTDNGYIQLKNMEILPCYLQSIQHNYNASSMTWHRGGKPTEVDMNLTFVEYRTLGKKDILKAYSQNEFDTAGQEILSESRNTGTL